MISGSTILAAVAVAAAAEPAPPPSEPVYPAPTPELACVTAPCGGVRLVDLTVNLAEPGGRGDELAARLELDDFGYLGFSWRETERSMNLSGARWELALEDDPAETSLEGEYRWPRWRLASRVARPEDRVGGGSIVRAEVGRRLGAAWEVSVSALDDSRRQAVFAQPTRPTSSLSLGAVWQPRLELELATRWTSAELLTPGGTSLDRDSLGADAVWVRGRWRLEGGFLHEETSGRFPRTEDALEARLDLRLTPHLVVHAAAQAIEDADFGNVESSSRVGLTYFARRHHFDREGPSAELTDRLVRRVFALGVNELADYTLEGRRRLRERLALFETRSGFGADLEREIEELYRAQIRGRIVPMAGLEYGEDESRLDGSRTERYSGFFAIPYSPRHRPFSRDQDAVDFLKFSYEYLEREVSDGFSSTGQAIALEIAVNREVRFKFSFAEPPTTGIEAALDRDPEPRLEALLEYRYGI